MNIKVNYLVLQFFKDIIMSQITWQNKKYKIETKVATTVALIQVLALM